MENRAFSALLCPHCGSDFTARTPDATAISCTQGHSFDIARQGYINLLTGHGTKFVPDTAAMVAARDAFLDAGHYQPLAQALAATVQGALGAATPTHTPLVVDAGTGTGWYLQQLHAVLPFPWAAVGLDISKFALRRAARRNPYALNVVWDVWQHLPLRSEVADVVMVVFAPRNSSEFARILKTDGTLVVVTPLPTHLASIAQQAGMLGIQQDKEEALHHSLAAHFVPTGTQEVQLQLSLTQADVEHVALMGPAGHHSNAAEPDQRRDALPDMAEKTETTAAFRISTFRRSK